MRKKIAMIILTVLCVLLLSSLVYADQSVSFTSIRRLAMGGTFAAHGEAEDVLWGNPANLALVEGTDTGIFKFRIGANKQLVDNIGTIFDIMEENDDVAQINLITQKLIPFKGNIDLGIMPFSMVKPNMGFAAVSQTKLNVRFVRPTSPRVIYNGISDNAIYFGYSRRMAGNVIFGTAVKYLYRFQTYDPASGGDEVTVGLAQMMQGGMEPSYTQIKGVGVDIGFLMPIRIPMLGECRMGIVITDLATRLSGSQKVVSNNVTTLTPFSDTIPKTITMGLAWNMGGTLFAFDWQVASPHKVTAKRFHFGVERKLSNLLTLRGGINEGYWVGGVSCKLKGFNIEYIYSKEELGNQLLENPAAMHYIKMGGQI